MSHSHLVCVFSDAGDRNGEPLAVAASTPARMSDGPLVYFAARCSGGTAIHAILRDLLLLHGVRLFAEAYLREFS